MPAIKKLTSIATTNSAATWTPTLGIVTSVLDSTNPLFLRNVRLDKTYITLTKNLSNGTSAIVGIPVDVFLTACAQVDPNITWAPKITLQPVPHTVVHPAASGFTITATAETAITYQWQISSDNSSFSDLSNAGVYSGVTTNTMAISDSTGLNAKYYRCIATNASGSTNSSSGLLTVT